MPEQFPPIEPYDSARCGRSPWGLLGVLREPSWQTRASIALCRRYFRLGNLGQRTC
jgi:hypothetical protein